MLGGLSELQSVVALAIAEAEVTAILMATKRLLAMLPMYEELFRPLKNSHIFSCIRMQALPSALSRRYEQEHGLSEEKVERDFASLVERARERIVGEDQHVGEWR